MDAGQAAPAQDSAGAEAGLACAQERTAALGMKWAAMYKNFIYNEDKNIIFAYVPKVACTNWKSILRRLNGAEDWLDNRMAHDREHSGLTYLAPDRDQPGGGLPAGAKRFAMVRDPYSRTLSAYLNKIGSRLPPKPESDEMDHWERIAARIEAWRSQVLDTNAYPEVNFEVFLLWLRDSDDPAVLDEHWAVQSRILSYPDVSFDWIGRFENLNEDSQRILEEIGSDVGFPTQDQVKFAPTNAASRLDAYLTPRTEALIEEIFAEDFLNFGYANRAGSDLTEHARFNQLKANLRIEPETGFVSVAEPLEGQRGVDRWRAFSRPDPTTRLRAFATTHAGLNTVIERAARANHGAGLKIFDIGSHLGRFAASAWLAASRLGYEPEVTCVEANPELEEALRANLQLYRCPAIVMNAAAAPRAGSGRLVVRVEDSRQARMIGPEVEPKANERPVSVPTISVADILPDSDAVSLVKVDLSGGELGFIRAIADCPRRLNNVFIVSYSPWQSGKSVTETAYPEWLIEHFQVYRLGRWFDSWDGAPPVETADAFADLPRGRSDLLLIPRASDALAGLVTALQSEP